MLLIAFSVATVQFLATFIQSQYIIMGEISEYLAEVKMNADSETKKMFQHIS